MTKVAILEGPIEGDQAAFRAVAGQKQSTGRTAGEALDALTAQLSDEESETLLIVREMRPDHFFGAAPRARLGELMDLWRAARDRGVAFPPELKSELDSLAEAELRASAARAAAMADELGR